MSFLRINKKCPYFPCHSGLEDCTFCFCPLYPCKDPSRGKFVVSSKSEKKIWSCKDCNLMHRKKTVNIIFNYVRNSQDAILPRNINKQTPVGIILIGHGSRMAAGNKTISDIAAMINSRCGNAVKTAYLQFARPTLSESILALSKKYKKIIIVPCFLTYGIHMRKDLPELIQTERKKYKNIELICARHLGADFMIGELVLKRIEEALHGNGSKRKRN